MRDENKKDLSVNLFHFASCVIRIRSFLLAIDRAQQDEETATNAGDGYSWCYTY